MKYDRLILAAVLLLLPTLFLGGIVAKNECALRNAKTWRVRIQGYDPRDLLYGHYLMFRFDWGDKITREDVKEFCPEAGECCLCLNEQSPYPSFPLATETSCGAAKQCAGSISVPNYKDHYKNSVFSPYGPQRYYIPEEFAKELEGYLRDNKHEITVDLRITKSGWTSLGDLYIDGIKWRDFLVTAKKSSPASHEGGNSPPNEAMPDGQTNVP